MTSILVVDNRPVVLRGLAAALREAPDLEVVGHVSSVDEAAKFLTARTVDVALVDLWLPDGLGLRILAQERLNRPSPAILILAAVETPQYLDPAIKLGASGFIIETISIEDFIAVVRRAANGKSTFTSRQRRLARGLPWASLTPREADVVAGVVRGESNEVLSFELGVSTKTIETYMSRIFERHGVHNRVELAVAAIRDGWLDVPHPASGRPAPTPRRHRREKSQR